MRKLLLFLALAAVPVWGQAPEENIYVKIVTDCKEFGCGVDYKALTVKAGDSCGDGQVLARDTAGTGFECVDAAAGGGGTASTFLDLTDTPAAFGTAGQLPAVSVGGDTLVFIDAPMGGGGSVVSVVAFKCILEDVTAANYSTATHVLECEASPPINEGAFIVEDASGTDTTDRVVIPEDGLYELIASIHATNSGSATRSVPLTSFTVQPDGGAEAVAADGGTAYVRGTTASSEDGVIDHETLVELDAGDRIGIVIEDLTGGSASLAIDGGASFLSVIKVGGAMGAAGSAGAAGAAGATGDAGADGMDGTDGTDGIDGVAGTDGAAGADGAQGPAGPQGVAGPQGTQGPQGLPGMDGTGGGGGGSATFVGLTDTPAALGNAGQAVVVNAAEDGLNFNAVSYVVPNPAITIEDLISINIDGVSYALPTAPEK